MSNGLKKQKSVFEKNKNHKKNTYRIKPLFILLAALGFGYVGSAAADVLAPLHTDEGGQYYSCGLTYSAGTAYFDTTKEGACHKVAIAFGADIFYLPAEENIYYPVDCQLGHGYPQRHQVSFMPIYYCPTGYTLTPNPSMSKRRCNEGYLPPSCISQAHPIQLTPDQTDVNKNAGDSSCQKNGTNPINDATGNKNEVQVDYQSPIANGLSFVRIYNGLNIHFGLETTASIGKNWSNTYTRSISVFDNQADILRPDGKVYFFNKQDDGTWKPDSDVNLQLIRVTTGWQLRNGNELETYDTKGRVVEILRANGYKQNLSYGETAYAHWLLKVSDNYGRSLLFSYDANSRISSITQPDGAKIQYTYSGNNLSKVTYPDGTSKTYLYENSTFPNALTGVLDEKGVRYATWTYDDKGRATSSEHAGGVDHYQLAYHDNSTDITDPRGTTRSNKLTTILGVVKHTGNSQPGGSGCAAALSSVEYDVNGNPISRTDFNGNTTKSSYDLTRNLETQRIEAVGKPEQRTFATKWHDYWRVPVKISEPSKITEFIYNGDGGKLCAPASAVVPSLDGSTKPINVLCKKIDHFTNDGKGALGLYAPVVGNIIPNWQWSYNQFGQVISATGSRTDVKQITTYSYYAADDVDPSKRGNLASVTNALNQTTKISAYDLNSNPLSIIDANGVETKLTYDAGQRITSRSIGSETSRYEYDAAGQLVKITQADGSFIAYSYDDAHRLTDISDALGNSIHYSLDNTGKVTKEDVQDPNGSLAFTRSHVYDALSRLAEDIGAKGQSTKYEYDANGNLSKVTDPLGHSTQSSYDALNHLIQQTDPNGGVTKYVYNGQDHLIKLTDPKGHSTTYSPDGFGLLHLIVSPDTGRTFFSYDAAGNQIKSFDAKKQLTKISYDALDRPTQISYADGSQTKFTWDQGAFGIGRLSQIDDYQNSSLIHQQSNSYDQYGNVVKQSSNIGNVSHSVSYQYTNGKLSGMTLPSGKQLSYQRNSAGEITQVNALLDGQNKALVQNVVYQAFGGIKSFTDGAGASHTLERNQDGQISAFNLAKQNWQLTYDNAGRITAQSETSNPSNSSFYEYDQLNRLTSGTTANTSYSYSYDANGNRTQKTVGANTRKYSIANVSNRLRDVSNPNQTYSYDANGNITNDGENQYVYDAQNHLVQVKNAAGTSQYQVDINALRIKKTSAGITTLYYYDQAGHLIAESGASGNIEKEYVWLGDVLISILQ